MTVYERYKKIQKIGTETEVPWHVARFFRDFKAISIMGDQISLGEDYGNLEEVRNVLGWLVGQLGGTIAWEAAQQDKK